MTAERARAGIPAAPQEAGAEQPQGNARPSSPMFCPWIGGARPILPGSTYTHLIEATTSRDAQALLVRSQSQTRPLLLRVEDRCLPLARQVLETIGVEQLLVKLASLPLVHIHERRVADDLLDPAAQLGARHWQSLRRGKPCGAF